MSLLRKNRLTTTILESDENKFRKELVDFQGKQWKEVTPKYPKAVGIECKSANYYYKEKKDKKRIVLHATHGVFSNDVANLSSRKVSTAYLIGRTGVVYELFDPACWSYHIGPLGQDYWTTNTKESSETIGIELSNIGPLHPHETKSEILLDSWGFPYCMSSQEEYYCKEEYREKELFATYTDEQYRALDSLLLHLCREFNIQHSFVDHGKRLDRLTEEPQAGIVNHTNYRADKFDVGPAFDWMRISGR